jgi:hypothetical protein
MKTLPQIKKHQSNDIWAPVGNYIENIITNKETSRAVTCVRHERKSNVLNENPTAECYTS